MTVAKEGKKTMAQKIDGLKSEFKKIRKDSNVGLIDPGYRGFCDVRICL